MKYLKQLIFRSQIFRAQIRNITQMGNFSKTCFFHENRDCEKKKKKKKTNT